MGGFSFSKHKKCLYLNNLDFSFCDAGGLVLKETSITKETLVLTFLVVKSLNSSVSTCHTLPHKCVEICSQHLLIPWGKSEVQSQLENHLEV